MENNTAINILNLTKKYGEFVAVNNLTCSIYEHEIFALLGVNGAGKTTTIKMLTGLTNVTSGDADILGYTLSKDISKIKKIVNISPQETAIATNLTVSENLKFIAEIYGIDKLSINSKVDELINLFDLESVRNKKSKLLSGGYKRRLSIAMAIITEPKILFLDEPTLGLDVLARHELWKIINNLKSKSTIILTTHYMEEAEQLADRIGIMSKGKLLDVDTPKNFVTKTNSKDFENAFIKIASEENV